MGASVRNSARQVGHQVAKYIMNTGLPDAVRSASATGVPSDLSMVNAGGISPTFVPSGAAGAAVGTAAGASVAGTGVSVAAAVEVDVGAGATVGDTGAAVPVVGVGRPGA
jgi:hypothetical protein